MCLIVQTSPIYTTMPTKPTEFVKKIQIADQLLKYILDKEHNLKPSQIATAKSNWKNNEYNVPLTIAFWALHENNGAAKQKLDNVFTKRSGPTPEWSEKLYKGVLGCKDIVKSLDVGPDILNLIENPPTYVHESLEKPHVHQSLATKKKMSDAYYRPPGNDPTPTDPIDVMSIGTTEEEMERNEEEIPHDLKDDPIDLSKYTVRELTEHIPKKIPKFKEDDYLLQLYRDNEIRPVTDIDTRVPAPYLGDKRILSAVGNKNLVTNDLEDRLKFVLVSNDVKIKIKKNGKFGDLLAAVTGMNTQTLEEINRSSSSEQGMHHDAIFLSSNLRVLWLEAHKMRTGQSDSLASSPTLFFYLNKWAAGASDKYRRHISLPNCKQLFVNLLLEDIRKHTTQREKATPYLWNMTRHAALILETILSLNTHTKTMTGIEKFVQYFRKEKNHDGYKNGRTGFIQMFPSIERRNMKARRADDVRRNSNENPIIINETDLFTFKRKLEHDIKNREDWRAACVLVEMTTGARISEIFAYSHFYTLANFTAEGRKAYDVWLKDSSHAFKEISLDNAIFQFGALKGRGPEKTWLPPKPVILGVGPSDIWKCVYTIIRPAIHKKLLARFPDTPFYEIPLTAFRNFNQEVNDYIRATFPNAAAIETRYNDKLTSHNFRKVYANWSFDEYGYKRMSRNAWISGVLGHDPDSLSSSLSYTGTKFNKMLKFSASPTDITQITEAVIDMNRKRFDDMEKRLDHYRIQLIDARNAALSVDEPPPKRAKLLSVFTAVSNDHPLDQNHNMLVELQKHRRKRLNTEEEKADEVHYYVNELFKITDMKGRHTHTIIPNSSNLLRAGFGKGYISCYNSFYSEEIKKMWL